MIRHDIHNLHFNVSMQAKLDEYCEEDEQVRKRLANILLILDTGDRSADLRF